MKFKVNLSRKELDEIYHILTTEEDCKNIDVFTITSEATPDEVLKELVVNVPKQKTIHYSITNRQDL